MTGQGKTTRFSNSDEVVAFCRNQGIEMVDLKFTDVPGTLQHVTLPVEEMTNELFEEGTGFDGSSIRGFQKITWSP